MNSDIKITLLTWRNVALAKSGNSRCKLLILNTAGF